MSDRNKDAADRSGRGKKPLPPVIATSVRDICGPHRAGEAPGRQPERRNGPVTVWLIGDAPDVEAWVGRLNKSAERFGAVLTDPLDAAVRPESSIDLVLIVDSPAVRQHAALIRRHNLAKRCRLGVVVLSDQPEAPAPYAPHAVTLRRDATTETIVGAVAALEAGRSAKTAASDDAERMQSLHRSLHRHLLDMDRDLQLAARLQRDFLPAERIEAGPVCFTSYYRPCTWVSGDIFDVFRLDEQHYGFYLADAVGHGVAAGLLTMYIKHAIRPKRIFKGGYELVPPGKVLARLNDQLAEQSLPDSQFITAFYGVINFVTLQLDYAVAGHPPPLVFDRSGLVGQLTGDGPMLGVTADATVSTKSRRLESGHRLVLYSDGLEPILIDHRPRLPALPVLQPGLTDLGTVEPSAFFGRCRERMDGMPGGLSNADDASVLLMDVREAGGV